MLFDKLCKISEKFDHDLKPILKSARLFIISDMVNDKSLLSFVSNAADLFFLPYRVTAIEDDYSLVLLSDTKADQVGIKGQRLMHIFMDVYNLYRHPIFKNIVGEVKKPDNPRYFSCGGVIVPSKDITEDEAAKVVYESRIYCEKYGRLHDIEDELIEYEDSKDSIVGKILHSAFSLIGKINQPDLFILETSPTNPKKSNKKIKRSHQRPIYTVLHPSKIRDKLHIRSNGTGGKKRPHERRRHIRYHSHARFSKDGFSQEKIIPSGPRRGQVYYHKSIIPSVWIGQSEKTIGNKRYRVILDK